MTHIAPEAAHVLPAPRERRGVDPAEWPQPEPLSRAERMTLFGVVGTFALLTLGGLYLWIVRGEVLIVEGSFDVLCF